MADIHSKEVRSYNMSQVKGKNTKPEILVRKYLFANGFRYKLHDLTLPGKPDLVLPKYKTVIFVNGCFWHGHEDCKSATIPKTKTDWWLQKISKNKLNDLKNAVQLSKLEWNIIRIWSCQLTSKKREDTLKSVVIQLRNMKVEQQ